MDEKPERFVAEPDDISEKRFRYSKEKEVLERAKKILDKFSLI